MRHSFPDETPEGRSVVVLAKEKFGIRGRELSDKNMTFIPFTAKTRMSGVDYDGNQIRKGAADTMQEYVTQSGGIYSEECDRIVKGIANQGGTPLVVAKNQKILGVIHLKDIIKQGVKEKFADLRKMGIKTIMITGDNPMTAAAIAAEAGVDDFLAEATPEGKLQMIRDFQSKGHLVAMTGDGTNDAPALAQADVAVAMNTGTQALPISDQINVANKWLYAADNGTQIRWGWKFVQENRLGGMLDYKNSMRDEMEKNWDWKETGADMPLYGSKIRNRGANGYFKIGMPVGPSVYDADEQDEMRSNLAFVADFDHFNENAYFGLNDYRGNENTLSLNLMYNHYFTYRSSLIVGAQGHLQYYRESFANNTPWIAAAPATLYDFDRNEQEVGAYAEYTYSIKDKFSVVAGIRGDYNAFYDKFFVTPRGHIRWNITPSTTLRGSAGLGYRSTNVITDNIGMLATGRQIVIPDFDGFNRLEKALTVGGSLTQTFGLVSPGDATLSFDYFRTQFYNSVIADQEYSADQIVLYNSDKRSYTDTYQIDFSWTPVERLDIFATFRYTDSEMTIDRPDGKTARVERPLVSQYKTLLNIQYATKFRRWVFDATAQLNGPARIPTQTGDLADDKYSPRYPMFFAQISRKVGKFDIYAGCENIADYRQHDPILNADNPYSTGFNSMNVWGPLMGRKFYIGLRFNLY